MNVWCLGDQLVFLVCSSCDGPASAHVTSAIGTKSIHHYHNNSIVPTEKSKCPSPPEPRILQILRGKYDPPRAHELLWYLDEPSHAATCSALGTYLRKIARRFKICYGRCDLQQTKKVGGCELLREGQWKELGAIRERRRRWRVCIDGRLSQM
jgi:hypothetical protein